MMITEDEITKIFCMADDFCKIYDKFIMINGLGPKRDRRKREYHRASKMSDSEVITIMILFHFSGYKCLKHFYVRYVLVHMRHLFPTPVSYNRFTELERRVIVPFILFLKKCLMGGCTGISFVDSTALRVCRNQRIHLHKVFKGLAQRGQCSMGWFYGFKLHLVCNERGELLSFMLTPGNVDDRDPLRNSSFLENISGKLVLGETRGGQRVHKQGVVRKTVYRWDTAPYETQEQKPMIALDRCNTIDTYNQLTLF